MCWENVEQDYSVYQIRKDALSSRL